MVTWDEYLESLSDDELAFVTTKSMEHLFKRVYNTGKFFYIDNYYRHLTKTIKDWKYRVYTENYTTVLELVTELIDQEFTAPSISRTDMYRIERYLVHDMSQRFGFYVPITYLVERIVSMINDDLDHPVYTYDEIVDLTKYEIKKELKRIKEKVDSYESILLYPSSLLEAIRDGTTEFVKEHGILL